MIELQIDIGLFVAVGLALVTWIIYVTGSLNSTNRYVRTLETLVRKNIEVTEKLETTLDEGVGLARWWFHERTGHKAPPISVLKAMGDG